MILGREISLDASRHPPSSHAAVALVKHSEHDAIGACFNLPWSWSGDRCGGNRGHSGEGHDDDRENAGAEELHGDDREVA